MQYFPLSTGYEYFFLHSWKVVPVLKVKIVFCVYVCDCMYIPSAQQLVMKCATSDSH